MVVYGLVRSGVVQTVRCGQVQSGAVISQTDPIPNPLSRQPIFSALTFVTLDMSTQKDTRMV